MTFWKNISNKEKSWSSPGQKTGTAKVFGFLESNPESCQGFLFIVKCTKDMSKQKQMTMIVQLFWGNEARERNQHCYQRISGWISACDRSLRCWNGRNAPWTIKNTRGPCYKTGFKWKVSAEAFKREVGPLWKGILLSRAPRSASRTQQSSSPKVLVFLRRGSEYLFFFWSLATGLGINAPTHDQPDSRILVPSFKRPWSFSFKRWWLKPKGTHRNQIWRPYWNAGCAGLCCGGICFMKAWD